jgi:hypothetical protein
MLIRPAIGDTDPIRYRRPNPDGQFSSNILDEAMRGQIWEPIDISHPEARFAACIGLVGLLYSMVFGIKLPGLSSPDAISLRLTSSGLKSSPAFGRELSYGRKSVISMCSQAVAAHQKSSSDMTARTAARLEWGCVGWMQLLPGDETHTYLMPTAFKSQT